MRRDSGVCCLSKLSQLKQDAYQAAKKRNWDEAVALYERILEVDKNNPTVINEMGDLCLKAGKTPQAVRYFLSAAAKYNQTGLLNNAVAIYKKILRYDARNLNAHWYLAETRSNQGLIVEGEIHALQFLDGSENMVGDLKEIFLKRCVQLLELYINCEEILIRLIHIFNTWDKKLEGARATLLHAAVAWDTGREDEARDLAAPVLKEFEGIRNYPEFLRWQKRVDPDAAKRSTSDYGAVDLDDVPEDAAPAVPAPAAPTQAPVAEAADPTPVPETAAPTPEPVVDIPANDGAITIDAEDDADFTELIAAAADASDRDTGSAAGADGATEVSVDDSDVEPDAAVPVDDGAKVDLLAEILSEEGDFLADNENSQLESISREIGAQVGGGGDGEDAESLYSTGTVYLEMGMYDQAWDAFAKVVATGDKNYVLRAREMWGVALQQANRHDEAVEVLRHGLDEAGEGPARIGMLYNIGKSCEKAGRPDEALVAYEEIRLSAPGYLDVEERMTALAAVQ